MKYSDNFLNNTNDLNKHLTTFIQESYEADSALNPDSLISIENFRTEYKYFEYYHFYLPNLPLLNEDEDLIDQLCQDMLTLTHCARVMSFNELGFISTNDLQSLPTDTVVDWQQASFADKMHFVEKKIGELLAFPAALLKIAAFKKELEEKIEKLHMNVSLFMLDATTDIFHKYARLLNQTFVEDSCILQDDGCYTPWCFDECESLTPLVATELYRGSLIVYGHSRTPITISFRDESYGKGAFFDHYNIQYITGRKTEFSLPNGLSPECFYREIAENPLPLKGSPIHNGKKIPACSNNDPDAMGLLLITGYSSKSPTGKRAHIHAYRISHEIDMVKHAKKMGQPLLAICGGLWTLLDALGGSTNKVKDHYGSMPSLLDNGTIDLGEKPRIHRLYVRGGSKLAHLMGHPISNQSDYHTEALSVHWLAANTIPPGFQVSAQTKPDKCIECIESTDRNKGTIIGIQGHPEAMRKEHPGLADASLLHHNLIRNLALEGDTYHQKRMDEKEKQVKKIPYAQLLNIFGVNKSRPNMTPQNNIQGTNVFLQ